MRKIFAWLRSHKGLIIAVIRFIEQLQRRKT